MSAQVSSVRKYFGTLIYIVVGSFALFLAALVFVQAPQYFGGIGAASAVVILTFLFMAGVMYYLGWKG